MPKTKPASFKEVMRETLAIVKQGCYSHQATSTKVSINSKRLRAAPSRSRMVTQTLTETSQVAQSGSGKVFLYNGDALDAASWLNSQTPCVPGVLDFASDSNPGGGCRGNQRGTQEEAICRRSSLLPSLEAVGYPIPTLGAVYAPDICVFRSSERTQFQLLPACFWVNVVASALRNRGNGSDLDAKQANVILKKVKLVLSTFAAHGNRSIVLGAWGCGAFGNDAQHVAKVFHKALVTRGASFDRIVFAVPGKGKGSNYDAFATVFAGCEQICERILCADARLTAKPKFSLASARGDSEVLIGGGDGRRTRKHSTAVTRGSGSSM